MLRKLSKELSLRPDSDIAVLCAFYKVPFSHDRAASVKAIVDAITATAMNSASSSTRVVSGRMPSKEEVIDSVRDDYRLNLLKEWLEEGGDPDILKEINSDYEDPLSILFDLDAIYEDYSSEYLYRIVEILIDKGADVNSTGYNGIPVVFKAATDLYLVERKDLAERLVKLLVEHGADINERYVPLEWGEDDEGEPVSILDYVTEGLEEYYDNLEEYDDTMDQRNKAEIYVREFLTANGFIDDDELLITTEEDAIEAFERLNRLKPLKRWLEEGGDPNVLKKVADYYAGVSPMNAIFESDYFYNRVEEPDEIDDLYALIETLVNKGVDVKLDHRPILTASSFIKSLNHRDFGEKLIKLFTEHGANINTKDSDGWTAWDYATEDLEDVYDYDRSMIPEQVKIIRNILKKYGATVPMLTDKELKKITENGDVDQIREYLVAGGNPNRKLSNNRWPLIHEVGLLIPLEPDRGESILKLMIEHGADINVKDDNGRSIYSNMIDMAFGILMEDEEEDEHHDFIEDEFESFRQILIRNSAIIPLSNKELVDIIKNGTQWDLKTRYLDKGGDPDRLVYIDGKLEYLSDLTGKIPKISEAQKKAGKTIISAISGRNLQQPEMSTDWQEICRSFDKQFTKEQIKKLVGNAGKGKTKRELCAMLAKDLVAEELKRKRSVPVADFVRKNCPRDVISDTDIGVDPISRENLADYNSLDLFPLDQHCYTRESLKGMFDAEDYNNPLTRAPLTDKEKQDIEDFLEAGEDRVHEMRSRRGKPIELSADEKIKMFKRQIVTKIADVPYLPIEKFLSLNPSQVAKLAKYVREQSGNLYQFTLGDISQSQTGLHAVDMFVDQMFNQGQEGGWIFVNDWFEQNFPAGSNN